MDLREKSEKRIHSAARPANGLARARRAAALETYATRKYGRDWAARRDRRDIEDEFNEWLARKRRV